MIACFFVGQLTWMFFVGIPFLIAWGIWWFIDLFLIMGWIEEINKDISLDGYDAKIKAVNDLYELYKSGAITQSEYETRKDILLK